jgi:hypothetical protein
VALVSHNGRALFQRYADQWGNAHFVPQAVLDHFAKKYSITPNDLTAGIMVQPKATAQPLYNQPAPVPDPSIAANQAIDHLSEAIKIPRSKDPLFQLQDQHILVAVQVVQDGSAQGFAVDQQTLKRQLLTARRLKLRPFSVAISLLTSPPELYYRVGLGNFPLHTMTPTKDAVDLKKALLTH